MRKILLVEDDPSLGETLLKRLIKEGYQTTWVKTLKEAEVHVSESPLDLVILDVGLPDGSGFDLAKRIREKTPVPFIFVTALSSAEHRLQGYELGAEEYIPKPFHLKELLLRVSHVLENHGLPDIVQCSGSKIDFQEMTIEDSDGKKISLPAKDMLILKLLISHSPKVMSRDDILDNVWGEENYPSNRTVDNIILRIRQALGERASKYIRSVRGVGYQWQNLDAGGDNGEQ